jgi:hypothetical protein
LLANIRQLFLEIGRQVLASARFYVDHIEEHGERLFYLACREDLEIWRARFGGHDLEGIDLEDTIWNDLEGIVAKRKHGRYNAERQVGSSLRIRLTRRLAAEKNCLKEESLRAGFGQESTIGLVAPIF